MKKYTELLLIECIRQNKKFTKLDSTNNLAGLVSGKLIKCHIALFKPTQFYFFSILFLFHLKTFIETRAGEVNTAGADMPKLFIVVIYHYSYIYVLQNSTV